MEPGFEARVPGATADHLALAGCGPERILGGVGLVAAVPIGDPLPHVSNHIIGPEARAAGGKFADRRGGGKAVVALFQGFQLDFVRFTPSQALSVAGVQVVRARCVITPRVDAAVWTACRELPL